LAQATPAWLRKMSESVSTDSQIIPVKYLRERLSSWASLAKPSPLAYQRHHSSKVITADSLFRPLTCQVSLTVPLYQLRSSGGGRGQDPLDVGVAARSSG
jgi:hypothetical protein